MLKAADGIEVGKNTLCLTQSALAYTGSLRYLDLLTAG
jgi:hypothetical protein